MTETEEHLDGRALEGLTVLLAEDNYVVAKDLQQLLLEQGARVSGPIPDVTRARALLAQTSPQCALLDNNLSGQFVYELAHLQKARGIPVIFATRYDSSVLQDEFKQTPCLQKPLDMRAVVAKIRQETTSTMRARDDDFSL